MRLEVRSCCWSIATSPRPFSKLTAANKENMNSRSLKLHRQVTWTRTWGVELLPIDFGGRLSSGARWSANWATSVAEVGILEVKRVERANLSTFQFNVHCHIVALSKNNIVNNYKSLLHRYKITFC